MSVHEAPRALLLRLTDHPGPVVTMLQRRTFLVLIGVALFGFRVGGRLRRSLLG